MDVTYYSRKYQSAVYEAGQRNTPPNYDAMDRYIPTSYGGEGRHTPTSYGGGGRHTPTSYGREEDILHRYMEVGEDNFLRYMEVGILRVEVDTLLRVMEVEGGAPQPALKQILPLDLEDLGMKYQSKLE